MQKLKAEYSPEYTLQLKTKVKAVKASKPTIG